MVPWDQRETNALEEEVEGKECGGEAGKAAEGVEEEGGEKVRGEGESEEGGVEGMMGGGC